MNMFEVGFTNIRPIPMKKPPPLMKKPPLVNRGSITRGGGFFINRQETGKISRFFSPKAFRKSCFCKEKTHVNK